MNPSNKQLETTILELGYGEDDGGWFFPNVRELVDCISKTRLSDLQLIAEKIENDYDDCMLNAQEVLGRPLRDDEVKLLSSERIRITSYLKNLKVI